MLATQSWIGMVSQPPLDVFLVSDTEVVIELCATADMGRMMAITAALQWWLGHKATLLGRAATRTEVEAAKARKAEEGTNNCYQPPIADIGETRLLQLMESFNKLGTGGSPKISTFSGTIPAPKNEATFLQWIHEVNLASYRYPETTVRNKILRSLKGSPAVAVSCLGPGATVSTILQQIEMLFGPVYPVNGSACFDYDEDEHPVKMYLNAN